MSQNKKNSRRKGAAVALAVLGVAGLTLASAAQLNLATPASVQAGVTDVIADCQPSSKKISVNFAVPTLSGENYVSSSVTFGNIDEECSGRAFKVAFLGAGDALLGSEVTGDSVGGTSMTVNLPSGASQDSVQKIALTIYG